MPNVFKADCGFDPGMGSHLFFEALNQIRPVAVDVMTDEDGWDVSAGYCYSVDLSAETSNAAIVSIENMEEGKLYKLIASNGATKKLEVTFPASDTLYDGTITPANGMTVVYLFFTDGEKIYCRRAIYS